MARRATKILQERQESEFLLVLDAGNSLTGDRDPARSSKGQTSVAAMNLMGYDAIALGPQDLALGPNVLRQRIDEAEFAVLSANAVVSPSGELLATPYVLHTFDSYQVAIVGLSGGKGTKKIAVRDPLETIQTVVAEVESQVDVIILLSHAGTSIDQQIAQAVPGIDLIVSGGEFQLTIPWQDKKTGTLILHADEATPGHAGRRIGIARLNFDTQGQLVGQQWQRLNLDPEVSDDPAMAQWVQQQLGQ